MSILLPHIPSGRAHACSVRDLAVASGMSARAVREELRRLLIEDHVRICSLPIPRGIWIAETPEELRAARAHLLSRLVELRERIDALDLCEQEMCFRPTLFALESVA